MIKYGRLLGTILFLLAGAVSLQAGEIEEIRYRGKLYKVYVVKLREANIQMVWKDKDGEPISNFNRLRDELRSQKRVLTFAMNGGIFNPQLEPVGLYIEKGKQLRPLNLEEGKGNFFLKPNGVFYIDEDDKAGIVTSDKYKNAVAGKEIRYAQQSGPQLLIDGKIHSAFTEGSVNQTVRNGVGIIDENTIVFAISQTKVNLYEFAAMFQEKYGCKNALYLDGAISEIYGKADSDRIFRNRFSAMIMDSEEELVKSVSDTMIDVLIGEETDDLMHSYSMTNTGKKVSVAKLSMSENRFQIDEAKRVSDKPQKFFVLKNRVREKLILACTIGGVSLSKGLVVLEGKQKGSLLESQSDKYSVFYMAKGNKMGVTTVSKYKTISARDEILSAFQGRQLISGGAMKLMEDTLREEMHYSGVGISREKNQLIFVSTDYHEAMSLVDFAEFFEVFGCEEAMLLHSGPNAVVLIRNVKYNFDRVIPNSIPVLLSAYKKE